MELRHLRYFIAVAELRSVRAASEQLHVTQPAISRQIQDLEEAVGAALFKRTPRGLVLTAAGVAYLAEAREILARVDAANRLARQIASGLQGHLRVGFVENAAWSGIVSRALREFEQAVPHVTLELQPMNTPEQLAAQIKKAGVGSLEELIDKKHAGSPERPLPQLEGLETIDTWRKVVK